MDEDGFVYFSQRIKRMIVTSGYNVYPSQLENILDGHEKVLLSCVIGVKDAYKMQRVKAFVVLKPGIEPSDEIRDELMAYCKERIAKYAMPKEIESPRRTAQDAGGQGGLPGPGGRGGGPGRRAGVVTAPKARIWELDAFRGVAILAVILGPSALRSPVFPGSQSGL